MRKTLLLSIGIAALLAAGFRASAQDYDPDRPFAVLHRNAYAEGGLKPRSAEDEAIRRGRTINLPAFMDMSDRRQGMDALLSPDDPNHLYKARHHVLGRTHDGSDGYGTSDDAQSWDGNRWGRPVEQSLLSLMGAAFVRNINNTATFAVEGKMQSMNGNLFDFGTGLLGTGAVDGAVGIVRVSDNQYRATVIIPGRLLASQLKRIGNGNSPLNAVFTAARKSGERGTANSGYGALNLLGFGTGLNLFDVTASELANADSVVVSVPEGSDVLFTVTDGKGGAQGVAFSAGGGSGIDFVAGGGAGSTWQRMGLLGVDGGVYGGFSNGQVAGFPIFNISGVPGGNNSNNNSNGGMGVAGGVGGFSVVPETRTLALFCCGLLGVLPFLRRKREAV